MKSPAVIVADLVTRSAAIPVRERLELSALSLATIASLETVLSNLAAPPLFHGIVQCASAAICTVMWGPLPYDISRIILWLVVFALWSVCAGTFTDGFISLHHALTPQVMQ